MDPLPHDNTLRPDAVTGSWDGSRMATSELAAGLAATRTKALRPEPQPQPATPRRVEPTPITAPERAPAMGEPGWQFDEATIRKFVADVDAWQRAAEALNLPVEPDDDPGWASC